MDNPFTCPECEKTSWHPMDKKHGWCAACKKFTSEEMQDLLFGRLTELAITMPIKTYAATNDWLKDNIKVGERIAVLAPIGVTVFVTRIMDSKFIGEIELSNSPKCMAIIANLKSDKGLKLGISLAKLAVEDAVTADVIAT